MIANIALTKIGATVAALAAPAMLFLGAGTGHAAGQAVAVWASSAPGGVDVVVETAAGDQGSAGGAYTSTVQNKPGRQAPRRHSVSRSTFRRTACTSRDSGSRATRPDPPGTPP